MDFLPDVGVSQSAKIQHAMLSLFAAADAVLFNYSFD
jgi:hypothetical protein